MSSKNLVAEAAASRASGQTMNASGKGDDGWIKIQQKTFTNWVNTQLEKSGNKVTSLEEDFKSGVNLVLTLENCSKKSLGKFNKAPRIPAQALENSGMSLKFMDAEGMKLVNIGPEDIYNGNLKLILGLIWTIIYHYQVASSFKNAAPAGAKKGTAKDLLLEWVNSVLPDYKITNFNTDWNDGRAICALTNAVAGEPWVLPNHAQMPSGAGARNAKVGIDAANEILGIPKLIAPEDLASPDVDDLSVVTYVSYFKDAKRVPKQPTLRPSEDNQDDRKAMTCSHPGCSARRKDAVSPYCPDHACHHDGCQDKPVSGTKSCPQHKCKHPSGCSDATQGDDATKGCPKHLCKGPACKESSTQFNANYCPAHGCQHPNTCTNPLPADTKKFKFCELHTCKFPPGCREGVHGKDDLCPTHTKTAIPNKLPPPWERKPDWRKYEGPDLGGRCKIRVFYSSTTSSQDIRKNTKALMDLLERENVHKRPDFEPWIPIDVDMPTEKRNLIFEKAKTRITPMLFIDDEYIGDFKQVMELNETGELSRLLEYQPFFCCSSFDCFS